MSSKNHCEEYTLITGASSGIGREFAEKLAQKGNNLVLAARRNNVLEELRKKFEEIYNVRVFTIPVDLSEEGAAEYIHEWCVKNNIKVNTIVNNAGAGLFGEFDKLDIDKQTNMIALNINCLVELTYFFIPELKKCSKAYILNVASIAALYPLPYYSVYGATKAFVLSFTQALRYEMRNSNITISCLCPGDTDTDFFKNAGNKNKKSSLLSPKIVVKYAIDSLLRNKECIFPDNMKLVSKIPRFILKRAVFKRVSKYKLT